MFSTKRLFLTAPNTGKSEGRRKRVQWNQKLKTQFPTRGSARLPSFCVDCCPFSHDAYYQNVTVLKTTVSRASDSRVSGTQHQCCTSRTRQQQSAERCKALVTVRRVTRNQRQEALLQLFLLDPDVFDPGFRHNRQTHASSDRNCSPSLLSTAGSGTETGLCPGQIVRTRIATARGQPPLPYISRAPPEYPHHRPRH